MLTAIEPLTREIKEAGQADGFIYLKSDYQTVRINFVTPYIARVCVSRGAFDTLEKPGVINKSVICADGPKAEGDGYVIESSELIIRADKTTSALAFYDKDGTLLMAEQGRYPVEFEEYDTFLLADEGGQTETISTPDGEKTVIKEAVKEFNGKSNHITWHIGLGDEAIYGLGQHEEGYGSLRGRTIYVHQANRKIAIPFFVSTRGYGVLLDTYSPIIFNDSGDDTYIYNESAHEWEYFFLFKGSMNGAIEGYRELTGKAALLPKWAFGYIQSKERYENEAQILEAADKSRELGLGMDCIVLDWMSWEDGRWGQKTFDKTRFGNAKEMIEKLHGRDIHFMISVWPSMDPSTDDYREFKDAGLLMKASNVYNPFDARARRLYWQQLAREIWPSGADAFWCDSSEPITPEWNVRTRPEPSALYHEYCREVGLRMGDEWTNAYALYHAMGIYEGQREQMQKESPCASGQKRVCNLTRSAYTGQQRYGTIMWSGDIEATWDTLRKQVGAGLNFSASGLPYWTFDIGAFFVKRGDFWYWDGDYSYPENSLSYRELYTRWFQVGALLPVFRAHGTDIDREMWVFGSEGDIFYDAMVKASRLRYKLMPYIYSEAGKAWLYDRSIIRPLAFDFAGDKTVWDITDQYMFGENIMAAPVVSQMYYDVDDNPVNEEKTRRVYLPEGVRWYDFYTKECFEGGRWIDASAPIDVIPLFVKEGSIIPMAEAGLCAAQLSKELSYEVYSDGRAEYELYTDAGDGYGYEKGEYDIRTVSTDDLLS